MSSDIQQIRIGLTNNHPCSYLADRMERVAVAIDPQMQTPETYEVLMANGFRRSGDTIYKRIVIIASLAKLCEFLRPILCQVKAKNVYSSCSAKSFIGS